MSLRDLEEELYKKEFDPVKRGADRAVAPAPPPPVPDHWASEASPDRPAPSHKPRLLLIGSILVGIGVIAVVGVFIMAANRDVGTVDVAIDGPDRLYRGVPFVVTVSVSNQRETPLRTATLVLGLPAGLILVTETEQRAGPPAQVLGDIGTGAVVQKRFTLLPIADVRSTQRLSVTVSYTLTGQRKLEANQTRDLVINENALTLELTHTEKALRGTPITVELAYRNVSGFDFKDVVIRARYPNGFTFTEASVRPDETGFPAPLRVPMTPGSVFRSRSPRASLARSTS